MGEAIRWPSFPANSEAPKASAWASRLCPQASWKITPPKPPSITTGITPAGQGSAWSIVTACSAAFFASSATATHAIRVYTRRSPVYSPSLLAIRTSLSQ